MKATLKRKIEIAAETMRFDFAMTDGRLNFRAGQFISLSLPEVRDSEGNPLVRYFSVCSSPEKQEVFSIATRMTGSRFKKWLASADKGSQVEINGPDGSMVLPQGNSQELVLIAGGIGITPFYSMIKAVVDKNTGHRITLFYSNVDKNRTAFYRELDKISREEESIEAVFIMTDDPTWQGPKEHIDDELIKNTIKDYKQAKYMAAGPPGMVRAVANVFDKLGLEQEQREVEEFMGY